MFQHTKFQRDDFKKLIQDLNNLADDSRLDDSVLNNAFNLLWPHLESDVQCILSGHVDDASGDHRTERDILSEILDLSRVNSISQIQSSMLSLEKRVSEVCKIILRDASKGNALDEVIRTAKIELNEEAVTRGDDSDLLKNNPPIGEHLSKWLAMGPVPKLY